MTDDVARQKLKQAAQMLMVIAFPRRGTEEERMDLIDISEMLQRVYTVEKLEEMMDA